MPVNTATVTHDAAALYRFVDSVAKLSAESSSSVYVKASDEFFKHISDLAEKTKEYLCVFPGTLPTKESLKIMHRQKLTVLRDAWAELHRFLKPATDADTLNTPFSLLDVLYRKFHKVTGFDNVEFTVFHLNEVNYLQVRASWFRQLVDKVAIQIPNAPTFPSHLGLIGIPYSQSSGVLLNALIPHEMGHFVYQRLDTYGSLLPHISACLDAELGGIAVPPNGRRWCIDKLASWTEEVFCDLFAIWMVGPAYSFAYIELLDLANIASMASIPSAPKDHLGFQLRHPADSFRLAQHVKFLRHLGWWPHVAPLSTHHVDVLKHVETVPQAEYKFMTEPSHLAERTLKAFFCVLPSIEKAIELLVGGVDDGSSGYAALAPSIEDYLQSGVVPSTITQSISGEDPKPKFEHPDPISVLNVAFKIHLESLDVLLTKVGQDPTSVRARSEWTSRLELWTAKAFEDYSLLAHKS